MRKIHVAAVAASVSLACAPALSQSTQASAVPAPACELHVWPSTELKSVTEGWVWNNRVNQSFDPAHGGVERPNVLSPQLQLEIIEALKLAPKLGMGDVTLVLHDEPLPRAAAAEKVRHSPSALPCYAELLVAQIIYEKNALSGASLRTLGIFRRFASNPEPESSFMTWANHPLIIFPAKKAEDAQAAAAEVEEAYRQTLLKFATFATRPAKKKR